MKKKKWALTAIILCVCLCFSSCTVFDLFSTESLLRAPLLTGEYAELQSAFIAAVGAGTVSVIPDSGDYRSAYCMCDFNGDGLDEAVIYYSDESTDDVVSICLMCYTDRQWKAVGTITGSGSGVYEMLARDLNGDGKKELITVWTLSDSGAYKTLSVYSVSFGDAEENGLSSIASLSVSDYMFYDFDGARGEEMLYVYRDSAETENALHLQLLGFDGETAFPSPLTQVDLPASTDSIEAIQRVLTEDGLRLFFDCRMKEGDYMTEVIDYSRSDAAFSFPLRAFGEETVSTRRNSKILCRDADNDGETEIPAEIRFSDGSDISRPGTDSPDAMIEWLSVTKDGIVHEKKYYVNFNDGYMLDMDSFYDLAFVSYDINSRSARFCRTGTGEIMFSVIFNANKNDRETHTNRIIVISTFGAEMNIKSSFVKSLITEITDTGALRGTTEETT